jgi:hypothetical protein
MDTQAEHWQRASSTTLHRLIKLLNSASRVWCMFTDAHAPQDASDLAEDLGVETDSPEHLQLEKSALCTVKVSGCLKRK